MNKVFYVLILVVLIVFLAYVAPWFVRTNKQEDYRQNMKVLIENGIVDTVYFHAHKPSLRVIEYHTPDIPSVRKMISNSVLKDTYIMGTITKGDTLNHKPNDKYLYVKITKGEQFTLEFYSE